MYSRVSESVVPEIAERSAGGTQTTYQFRIFLPRCETYAIRFAGSEVTGVCGPLEYDEVLFRALPTFSYESQVDCINWVKANFNDFILCDKECDKECEESLLESVLWI